MYDTDVMSWDRFERIFLDKYFDLEIWIIISYGKHMMPSYGGFI